MGRYALMELPARAYLCSVNLQQASITDYESVLAFYGDVIERTPHIVPGLCIGLSG